MDAKERARLRALCETIPEGDVTPCCTRAGEDGHHSSWALGATPHGAALRAWVAGPLDLLALARAVQVAMQRRDAGRDWLGHVFGLRLDARVQYGLQARGQIG